ncbi:MAG: hypothetical protein AB7O57_15295 [Hyphomicrobiaceae bacterium]
MSYEVRSSETHVMLSTRDGAVTLPLNEAIGAANKIILAARMAKATVATREREGKMKRSDRL